MQRKNNAEKGLKTIIYCRINYTLLSKQQGLKYQKGHI